MAPIDYSIKAAEKVLKLDGTIKNVELSRLTKPGDNFLSLILKADFEIEKDGKTKTVNAVAKRLPLGRKEQVFDFLGFCMINEIRWYSKIAPLIEEYAEENEIEIDFFPKHLGSRLSLNPTKRKTDEDGVLFMENLAIQGYNVADRQTGFDLTTAKAILRRLAVFHALPIAMKIKNPEKFKILSDLIEKAQLPKPPSVKQADPGQDTKSLPKSEKPERKAYDPPPGAERTEEVLWQELQKIYELSPYLSRLESKIVNPMNPAQFNMLTEEPWNTIVHNDFWVNNVMVKYRKDDKEPLIKIVDFQMYSYSSYAKDLGGFLLNSINNDVIRESLDELLRFYYDAFTSVLRQTSTDVELTYDDYLKDIKKAVETQIGLVIHGTTLMFAERGSVIDTAVEDFDPFKEMPNMIRRMTQKQKEKIVVIASESAKRGWI